MESIILLDGSKGAGKSSVSRMLAEGFGKTTVLSFDEEKGLLKDGEKSKAELSNGAFENIIGKAKEAVSRGENVIIDCGLTAERVPTLDKLALDANASLHKFLLTGSRDELLERVKQRDIATGKTTDVERFDEVYDIIHGKNLDDYVVIETESSSVAEIVQIITDKLSN